MRCQIAARTIHFMVRVRVLYVDLIERQGARKHPGHAGVLYHQSALTTVQYSISVLSGRDTDYSTSSDMYVIL